MAKSASKVIEAEIERLQKEFADTDARIQRIQRELDGVSADLGQYERSVQPVANQVAALQGEVALREKHAVLVAGSEVVGEAIRRLAESKEQLTRLQQQLEQAKLKSASEKTRADQREKKLREDLALAKQEEIRLGQDIADHQVMHRHSHADEGQVALAPLMAAAERLIKERSAAQARLAEVDVQIAALREKVDQGLMEWPELGRNVRQLLPYEDGFVRVLEGYIHLIETAMRERQDLSRISSAYGHNHLLFTLDRNTAAQFFGGGNALPPALVQKKAELQSVLDEYLRKQK